MNELSSEITVIGAGPSGSTISNLLSDLGYQVLLLEKSTFPREKICGDAISPLTAKKLKVLNQSDWLDGYKKISGVRIFYGSKLAFMAYVNDKKKFNQHGYIVPRSVLDLKLLREAEKKGTNILFRARAIKMEDSGKKLEVIFEGKKIYIRSKLFIFAVGSNSRLLKNSGYPDYAWNAMALRGYYDGVTGLDECINIIFEPFPVKGYGWVFPLNRNECNVGWGSLSERTNASELKKKLTHLLNNMQVGDLDFSKAQCRVKPKGSIMRMNFGKKPVFLNNLVCLGDCAGLISPLTGEGIGHAMESAFLLADSLSDRNLFNTNLRACLKKYDNLLKHRFRGYFFFARICQQMLGNKKIMEKVSELANADDEFANDFVAVFANAVSPSIFFKPTNLLKFLEYYKKN